MNTLKSKKLASLKNEVRDLHPLLKELLPKLPTIIRAEYTHGVNEIGADFVLAQRHPVLGHQEYIGVIAKVGSIQQDYTDLDRQIQECDIPRLFFGGKEEIRISEIWIVATGRITRNAQEKIHEQYKSRRITFLDNNYLTDLIDKYIPFFWTDLPVEVGAYLAASHAKNEELDRTMSLVQVSDRAFYIQQDIFQSTSPDYRKGTLTAKEPERVDIFKSIHAHKLILVEGGMGSGKSKLLRRLFAHYSQSEVFAETHLLPISLTYKEILDDYDSDINALLKTKVGNTIPVLPPQTQCLLFIDAVDEKKLPADEQLDRLEKLIERISEATNVKAVITSRYLKIFDKSNTLQNRLMRYELQPLSLNKTLEFITVLCTNLNLTKRVIEDLKRSQLFKELPRSPISAILLAKLINENAQDLPSNMTELYAKYTELSLGRWDIDKGLQSQKEYQSLDSIVLELSRYMIDNEIVYISAEEAKGFFTSYLKSRHLTIDLDSLFENFLHRSELIAYDSDKCTVAFKHRTFGEFFYARAIRKENAFTVDERAVDYYWMNIYFFYVGLLKDCPNCLKSLIAINPKAETGRWLKLINMSNYLLAGYATPYDVITEGIKHTMLEAAQLYKDIVDRKVDSPFAFLPQLGVLWLLQLFIRESYAYEFFREAFETAALMIDDDSLPSDIKAYATYFLNVACLGCGSDTTFDFLLEKYQDTLPLDLAYVLKLQAEDMGERSLLMKKQDKRIKRMLHNNPALLSRVEEMYKKPVKLLKPKQGS